MKPEQERSPKVIKLLKSLGFPSDTTTQLSIDKAEADQNYLNSIYHDCTMRWYLMLLLIALIVAAVVMLNARVDYVLIMDNLLISGS